MVDTIFDHKADKRSPKNGQNGNKSVMQMIAISLSSIILSAVLLWIGTTLNDIKVNTAVMATKIDYVVLGVQENRLRIETLEQQPVRR